MEERNTAAVVLGILALAALFFAFVLPWINFRKSHTISYKNCHVSYSYMYQADTVDDGYIAAENKLSLCICSFYDTTRSAFAKTEIMKRYKKYGPTNDLDTFRKAPYNFDSVLKYRNKIFDTTIMVD
jgi:hypothetical protein